jgi:NMD protein affecting ribosome stability and mRNA decay
MKQRDLHRKEQRHDMMKAHLIDEHRHDPYKSRGKLHEPSVCPQCSAVFTDGRWQWLEKHPQGAAEATCPACHRTNDKYPAGELTLSGAFAHAHRAEIIGLARNTEAAEKSDHPMQRIMDIAETDQGIVITTTDIHLPHRIGHAITSAFKGHLNTHYDEAGHFVRMSWTHDK